MDFIRRKLDARSQSAVLILLFFMILGIFAAATGGAILLGCWVDDQLNGEPLLLPQAMDNLALLLGASTLITLFYLLITSGFKLRHLRGGGEQIARILGARHLYPSCREPCEKRAMNVLQEMSIAAGIIPPSLYVLDAEKAINAMAAGTVNNEPAVILTLGAVRLLSRDELAAVISHELGHIINKDTSINAYLTALTSPLEWLSLTGKKLVQIQLENNSDPESVEWGCSSGNRGRLPISTKPVPGLVLVVVAAFTIYWSGVLGLLLARLLKSALSRTREHLADACAVEFTRNPWALASCLKKIAALEHHSYLSDPLAEEFSHFFLADSNKEWLGRWMSTHPPIEERIWQAEPGWDGAIDAISYSDLEQRFAERWGSPQLERQYLLKTTRGHVFTFIAPLFERFAQPDALTLEENADIKNCLMQIPGMVLETASDPYGARALVVAAFLSKSLEQRDNQLEQIRPLTEKLIARRLRRLMDVVPRLPLEVRLFLLKTSLPLLEELSKRESAQFVQAAHKLLALPAEDAGARQQILSVLEEYLPLGGLP